MTTIVLDTTYFKRGDGLLVIRSTELKKNLYGKFIERENFQEYQQGIECLLEKGWKILGATCDIKRGIRQAIQYHNIPAQYCLFHQRQLLGIYLTNNPKTPARKELLKIANNLKTLNTLTFSKKLDQWLQKWRRELQHDRKLKSSYRSLKTNLPYLFTYLAHPHIPFQTTTNSIEGWFSHLKDKLRIHRGIKLKKRNKMIQDFLFN